MDRRSLKRLLVRLANEKQIKSIRTVLRCGDKERTLHFICQPSITMENSVIRSAIEQAKLKLFCVSKSGLTRYSFKNNQQSDPSAAGFVALPDNLKEAHRSNYKRQGGQRAAQTEKVGKIV